MDALKKYEFPAFLRKILETLKDASHEAYIVGGSVRDILLGISPDEWDITTNATPDQVTALFPKVVPTGLKFGTVTVLVSELEKAEITTYRSDERYTDGRHPDNVRFTKKLDEDLARRDFTVNALAYDPITATLVDLHKGQADLRARFIRTVGVPIERFREDGLRPVRACRFAAQLNFEIDPETLASIPKGLDVVEKVAPERIRDEIIKLLKAEKPSVGFEYMRKAGLLKIILPELEECVGVEQPKSFHKYDVYWHNLIACDSAPRDNVILRLSSLFHDISKPECKVGDTFYNHEVVGAEKTKIIMKRLKFSNDDMENVSNLVRNHMFNYVPEWSDSAVRRFIKRVGLKNIEPLFLLRKADVRGMEREVTDEELAELRARIKKAVDEENALHVKQLAVDGEELMKSLTLSPGPEIGRLLNALLEKVLDDPTLNTKETLLTLAQEIHAGNQ